jgi:hypothetical protein
MLYRWKGGEPSSGECGEGGGEGVEASFGRGFQPPVLTCVGEGVPYHPASTWHIATWLGKLPAKNETALQDNDDD